MFFFAHIHWKCWTTAIFFLITSKYINREEEKEEMCAIFFKFFVLSICHYYLYLMWICIKPIYSIYLHVCLFACQLQFPFMISLWIVFQSWALTSNLYYYSNGVGCSAWWCAWGCNVQHQTIIFSMLLFRCCHRIAHTLHTRHWLELCTVENKLYVWGCDTLKMRTFVGNINLVDIGIVHVCTWMGLCDSVEMDDFKMDWYQMHRKSPSLTVSHSVQH